MPHCDDLRPLLQPEHAEDRRHVPGVRPPGGGAREEKITRFETEGAPWHFKLLVAVTVIYLGWRLVQLVFWIFS